jgi:lysyl-tRNA synthetase class 2
MAEQTVPETNTDTLERIRQGRIEKADKLRALGVDPYPYKFDISHRADELHERYAGLADDTVTTDTVQVLAVFAPFATRACSLTCTM